MPSSSEKGTERPTADVSEMGVVEVAKKTTGEVNTRPHGFEGPAVDVIENIAEALLEKTFSRVLAEAVPTSY